MSLGFLSIELPQFKSSIISKCGVTPEFSLVILHAVFALLNKDAIMLWKYCLFACFITLFSILQYFL